MKAKMTVYEKGGKMPIGKKKKDIPAHLKSTTSNPTGTPVKKSGGTSTIEKDGALTRTYNNPAVVGDRFYERIDTTGYSKGLAEFPYEEGVKVVGGTDFILKRDIPRQGVPGVLKRMNEGKDLENNMKKTTVKKYQNGGKAPIVPDPKKKKPMTADQKFNANAKAREMENLTEMRNQLKKADPDAVSAFDRELKAKGMMVTKKPVKKYAGGGKMNVAGATSEDQYKYMGYGKGGKMYSKGGMMKYLKGGQVKLDANKDGKISGDDFKVLKKK